MLFLPWGPKARLNSRKSVAFYPLAQRNGTCCIGSLCAVLRRLGRRFLGSHSLLLFVLYASVCTAPTSAFSTWESLEFSQDSGTEFWTKVDDDFSQDNRNGGRITTGCHSSCATCASLETGTCGPDQRSCCLSCEGGELQSFSRPSLRSVLLGYGEKKPSGGAALEAPRIFVEAHEGGPGFCVPVAFNNSSAAAQQTTSDEQSDPSHPPKPEEESPYAFLDTSPGSCHESCATCRADCCSFRKDNCLSCAPGRTFSRVYRDGTGRCLPTKGKDGSASARAAPARKEERERRHGLRELIPRPSLFSPLPGPDAVSEASAEKAATRLNFVQTLLLAYSLMPAREAADASSKRPSASAASALGGVVPQTDSDFPSGCLGGCVRAPPPGTSFLRRRSLCESLPKGVKEMQRRGWGQFVFMHGDNNLSDCMFLDLEEMLQPWVGQAAASVFSQKRFAGGSSAWSGEASHGGAVLGSVSGESALELMHLVVLIDGSGKPSELPPREGGPLGLVHVCPGLDWAQDGGPGVRKKDGEDVAILDSAKAFLLLRIHLVDGQRHWLLLKALGEVRPFLPTKAAKNHWACLRRAARLARRRRLRDVFSGSGLPPSLRRRWT